MLSSFMLRNLTPQKTTVALEDSRRYLSLSSAKTNTNTSGDDTAHVDMVNMNCDHMFCHSQ